MATHPMTPSSSSPNLHNTADLAAVLANANTTLRNAGLLSALLQGSQQLPPMFIEAEDQRPVLDMNVGLNDDDDDDDNQQLLRSAGTQIPIIDMSVLTSSSEPVEARSKLVASIAEACEKFGFFQVVNHGVDRRLIERCEAEAHKMFELPLDVKERVHRPPGTSFGYGANTWVNQTVMHWAESFHMQLHPVSNIRDFSGKLFAEGDPTKFSSTVEEYMAEIEKLARELLELLTEGLGLEPSTFNHYVEQERMMSMRFNLYPPCPQPDLAIGLRAHTDPHLLTILHQDEIAGLQVYIDDKWITVKPRPDCFVVNIGDLFQVLSNTRYKSVLHRAAVNGVSKRLSLACFLNPPLSATVEAPQELITKERPQVYRPFTWHEYLTNAYKFHPATGGERHERFFR